MLQFNDDPKYIYYAHSVTNNEKLLGVLSLVLPTQSVRYELTLSIPTPEITEEERKILLEDMLEFLLNSENYIKADS